MFYVYIYTNIINVLRTGMNMSISRSHIMAMAQLLGVERCCFCMFYVYVGIVEW